MKYLKPYQIFELHQDTYDSYIRKRILKIIKDKYPDSVEFEDIISTEDIDLEDIIFDAIEPNAKEIVKLLLDNGFDYDTTNRWGESLLDVALGSDKENIVDVIISKIAEDIDPRIINHSGDSNDGYYVHIVDYNTRCELDVRISIYDGDCDIEWGQDTFHTRNNMDMLIKAMQSNTDIWETCTSMSLDYLINEGLIVDDNDGYKYSD